MLWLIAGFFNIPIKNKEKTYEKIIEMSRNNDHTTGNLLDYEYFSNSYKLIAIDVTTILVGRV